MDAIYEKLFKTFKSLALNNGVDTGTVIDRAREALRSVSQPPEELGGTLRNPNLENPTPGEEADADGIQEAPRSVPRSSGEFGKTLENPTPGKDTDTDTALDRALEALRLISHLSEEGVALKNYDLFRVVMGASVPENHSEGKWEAARLALSGAYVGDKFVPQIEGHQDEDTYYILDFLNYHFNLTAKQGQDQDEPIRIALRTLACISNPASIAALKFFDPTENSFVRGVQYTLGDIRPSSLREAALLFLPLVCDQWFKTGSTIVNLGDVRRICVDWASAVDRADEAPVVKTAALTFLLGMIGSPDWRPHIVPTKFALLEGLKSVPDDFQPLRSRINNPGFMDAIEDVENTTATVHWVAILWANYVELGHEMRERLETITKEILRKEQTPDFDGPRLPVGELLSDMDLELGKVNSELERNPTTALEMKSEDIDLAIGTLKSLRDETQTDAED